VDNSLKKIVEAGGAVTQPKKAVLGIGYVAYCTDIEGDLFGVIQPDMSMK
jgi:predicted enzyme related to lactoylglutathione lyase